MVYSWLTSIQSRLFPPLCVLCGAAGCQDLDLCAACLAALPSPHPACPRCAAPLPPGSMPGLDCGHCQHSPPAFHAATALWRYRPPVDHLVQGFKFHGRLALGRLMAEAMARELASRGDLPDALIPVPLHPSRLRERGFNQALELARGLGRRLDIPVQRHACRRVRATAVQSLLPVAARRRNLRSAFELVQPPGTDRVAIIDDVMTSGHTVNELARVLVKGGVKRVEVWIVARAGR